MKILRAGDAAFPESWERLQRSLATLHPFATESDLRYQREYLRPDLEEERNLSFLVATDGDIPLYGLRLFALRFRSGRLQLSSMGRSLVLLEDPSGNREADAAFDWLKEELLRLLAAHPGAELYYRDYLPRGSLSKLSLFLLDRGARARAGATQILDLAPAEEQLRSGLRKSYRSLVNQGLRELDLQFFDQARPDRAAFDSFQRLHVTAAGRETRPAASWDRHFEALAAGEAFLVNGSLEGEVVTGGLFLLGRAYCYYGVSASRRDLFDRPLSHAVIWKALLHAKSLGVRTFELGDQYFPFFPGAKAEEVASPKEVSIATFKRGFGGECRCMLDLTLS